MDTDKTPHVCVLSVSIGFHLWQQYFVFIWIRADSSRFVRIVLPFVIGISSLGFHSDFGDSDFGFRAATPAHPAPRHQQPRTITVKAADSPRVVRGFHKR